MLFALQLPSYLLSRKLGFNSSAIPNFLAALSSQHYFGTRQLKLAHAPSSTQDPLSVRAYAAANVVTGPLTYVVNAITQVILKNISLLGKPTELHNTREHIGTLAAFVYGWKIKANLQKFMQEEIKNNPNKRVYKILIEYVTPIKHKLNSELSNVKQ